VARVRQTIYVAGLCCAAAIGFAWAHPSLSPPGVDVVDVSPATPRMVAATGIGAHCPRERPIALIEPAPGAPVLRKSAPVWDVFRAFLARQLPGVPERLFTTSFVSETLVQYQLKHVGRVVLIVSLAHSDDLHSGWHVVGVVRCGTFVDLHEE
jgi:hypothetical protein